MMLRATAEIENDISTAKGNIETYKGEISACETELQDIENNINELQRQKAVLEESHLAVSDLRDYLVGGDGGTGVIGSLNENCVCIKEIKSDVSAKIFDRCRNALNIAETVVIKLEMDIKSAEENYSICYNRQSEYRQKLSDCQSELDTLDTELTDAQIAEENAVT